MKIKLSITTIVCMGLFAHANDTNTSDAHFASDANLSKPSKKTKDLILNDVFIKGKKKITTKTNDITGLGRVVKSSKQLDKEQALGIRDLTRYEPGIAVVEQGSGASVGYSMRGVDKNRVSVLVDGLHQSQSYTVQGGRPGSGAINEIEIENVSSVEFSKGSDSAFYGGGALGGAVAFRTKEASDLIEDGKQYALKAKTSYSSKNEQKTHSLAGAYKNENGFEILGQVTLKDGHETKGHEDAWRGKDQYIYKEGVFAKKWYFDDVSKRPPMFCISDEDPTCSNPKFFADFDTSKNAHIKDTDPSAWANLNAEQQASYNKQYQIYKNKKIKVSPKDYTGAGRLMPNPLDYDSKSFLVNASYSFKDHHKIGSMFEKSTQNFLMRDMSVPATYAMNKDTHEPALWKKNAAGVYWGDNISSGIRKEHQAGDASAYNYTRALFSKEKHTRNRYGFYYELSNLALNKAKLSFNNQEVKVHHDYIDSRCSKYPNADASCKPSLDKPWSSVETEKNKYNEKTKSYKIDLEKKFKLFQKSKWDINFQAGLSDATSILSRDEYKVEYVDGPRYQYADGNTTYPQRLKTIIIDGKPTEVEVQRWKKVQDAKLGSKDLCEWTGVERRCEDRKIKGDGKFVLLNQKLKLNKYLAFGLALRHDTMKYRSHDSWIKNKDYSASSYNVSFILSPIKHLNFLYRQSTGFRFPSYAEMFGYRTPGFEKGKHDAIHYISDLKPEKSLNKEFGVELKGNIGRFQASYFLNDYIGLIAMADKGNKPIPGSSRLRSTYGFHNVQDMSLKGINLQGSLDLNAIYEKVPEGLFVKLAYDKTDVKKASFHEKGFRYAKSYVPDAIKPSRYVAGLVYDHPSSKWGVEYDLTYSDAKKVDELYGYEIDPVTGERTRSKTSSSVTTPSWTISDISGYYKYKGFTFRAGVYNIFNYAYLTWENVRQSSTGAVHQNKAVQDYARYAAPGRNFTATFEYKF